jgi:hypothetical protein
MKTTKTSITLSNGQTLTGKVYWTRANLNTIYNTSCVEKFHLGKMWCIVTKTVTHRRGEPNRYNTLVQITVSSRALGQNYDGVLTLASRSYNWWMTTARTGEAIRDALGRVDDVVQKIFEKKYDQYHAVLLFRDVLRGII